MRIVLLFLAALCSAGPVGRYLGFSLDIQMTGERTGRDSIHFLIGGDSVYDRGSIDTATVISETTRLGLPAWIIRRSSNPASPSLPLPGILPSAPCPLTSALSVTWDTVWEQGDSFLFGRQTFFDTVFETPSYRTPFAVGSWWHTGIAGRYYMDLNGDTLLDTLDLWADTCRVTGRDTITVPYGAVPDCWRIERTMRQALALIQDTLPVRETSLVRSVEWYKDSLWGVKETLIITGRIYTKVFIWLPVADLFSNSVGLLTGLRSGVAEPRPPSATRISPSATIIRDALRLTPSDEGRVASVELLDVMGRTALARTLDRSTAGPLPIDVSHLSPGLYFLRTTSGRESVSRPIIVLR